MKSSLLTICTFAGGAFLSVTNAQEKPNIILFLVDDVGLMDTSLPFLVDAQGNSSRQPLNDWYHTPNMERLSAQGVRFSTFYAQSVSSPSQHIVDGIDLKKLISKIEAKHDRTFLMHFPHEHRTNYFTTFRDGDWKLIYYYHPETPNRPGYSLYNLANDEIESHDLAAIQSKRVKQMMKKMVK